MARGAEGFTEEAAFASGSCRVGRSLSRAGEGIPGREHQCQSTGVGEEASESPSRREP